jgi:hypothetical protein
MERMAKNFGLGTLEEEKEEKKFNTWDVRLCMKYPFRIFKNDFVHIFN